MRKKVCRYLRIRKKLGGGFRKEEDKLLNAYGLTLVKHTRSGWDSIISEENEFVLIPFKQKHIFHYWPSYDKSYIIVSTGQKVFQKNRGEEYPVKEIEELKNMSLVHWFDAIALVFESNDDSLDEYKILNLKTGEITKIPRYITKHLSILKDGIELKNKDVDGYRYMYLCNEEIVTSALFAKQFTNDSKYQINRVKEEEWKLYELSREKGIIEKEGPWDSVETLWYLPVTHLVIKGNEAQVLNISSKGYKLSPIPGTKIQLIGTVDDVCYYQIIGEKKVYLCIFEGEEIKILSEYAGDRIAFSKPILDLKKGEIKKDILVTKVTTQKAEI